LGKSFSYPKPRYCGIDISTDMLKIAQLIHFNAKFKKKQIVVIPYMDTIFNFAFSIPVVRHNRDENQ
jgi:hypothetical protein